MKGLGYKQLTCMVLFRSLCVVFAQICQKFPFNFCFALHFVMKMEILLINIDFTLNKPSKDKKNMWQHFVKEVRPTCKKSSKVETKKMKSNLKTP